MSKVIDIINGWRVNWDGRQFSLEKFDEGGEEARNPATGKKIITKSAWKPEGRYYPNISGAVEYVIKNGAAIESDNLNQFLENEERLVKEVKSNIGEDRWREL